MYKVAKQFLAKAELGENKQIRIGIENYFPYSFGVVNTACNDYFKTDRRFCYTTPKTYLEFLNLFIKNVAASTQQSTDAIERLQSGLTKLKETGETVVVIEAELKISLAAAEIKKEKAEGIAEVVSREKAIVEDETAKANVEAKKCGVIKEEVTKIATDAQRDLDAAEPLVAKAMAALDSLNKKDLGECKTMSKPPSGVDDVFSAVMVSILSEGAAREWSTVVDISIPPPSFKPVSLSLSRSPLSKTPKQVFFNPINIFYFYTLYYCFIIYFFSFNVNIFINRFY